MNISLNSLENSFLLFLSKNVLETDCDCWILGLRVDLAKSSTPEISSSFTEKCILQRMALTKVA